MEFEDKDEDDDIDSNHKYVVMGNKFDLEMKRKASAWYIVTMNNIARDNRYALSFPFVVFDVLCNIIAS